MSAFILSLILSSAIAAERLPELILDRASDYSESAPVDARDCDESKSCIEGAKAPDREVL